MQTQTKSRDNALHCLQKQKKMNPLYLPGLTNKTTDDFLYPELNKIAQSICKYFNTSMIKLRKKQRYRTIVQPRQIGMYLSSEFTHYSASRIGSYWGGFDHATVLHAKKTVMNLYDTDRFFRNDVNFLYNELYKYFSKEEPAEIYSYQIDHDEKRVELYLSEYFTFEYFEQLRNELQEEDINNNYIIEVL